MPSTKTDKTHTFERIPVELFAAQMGAEPIKKGWKNALAKWLKNKDELIYENFNEGREAYGIIPDAMFLLDDEVVFLEVEDTNMMTAEKMGVYVDMMADFDSVTDEIRLRLFVSDRYGQAKEVDLMNWFLGDLYSNIRQSKTPTKRAKVFADNRPVEKQGTYDALAKAIDNGSFVPTTESEAT